MNTNCKLSVLIATGVYPPEIGGPATYTALMEKELPRYGFTVSVLPFRTVRHLPKIIRHIVFFFKILSRGKHVDLLYAQDPVSVGLPMLCVAKILRKPFIMRVAGDYAWEQSVQRFGVIDSIDDFQKKSYFGSIELLRNIQKFTARHADRVITPSIYFRDLVRGWVHDTSKVVHIYNGVDFNDVAAFTGAVEPKTLISAGRLLPWKGFDTLIHILPKLSDWKLYIAGDGPDMEVLSRLAKELGVSPRVHFLGSIPRGELLKKLQQSEIFVLNTLFESFSFQVVEAMYTGVPIITTNVGNLAEIVEDGKEGILVEPNNETEIVNAIEKIHSDRDFRDEIVRNALKKSKLFSIQSTMEKTAQLMRKAIEL